MLMKQKRYVIFLAIGVSLSPPWETGEKVTYEFKKEAGTNFAKIVRIDK